MQYSETDRYNFSFLSLMLIVFGSFVFLSCSPPMACADASAHISQYSAPNMENLKEESALVWIKGVLGGDRSYYLKAVSLFEGQGNTVKTRVNAERFLVLREAAYPASTFSMGQAVIESVKSDTDKVTVSMIAPDIESLIKEKLSSMKHGTDGASRTLAEWLVMDSINKDGISKMKHISVVRNVPVNIYGRLVFGNNIADEILNAPEKDLLKALKTLKETKSRFGQQYVNNLKAIIDSSTTISFSPELKKAVNDCTAYLSSGAPLTDSSKVYKK